MKNISSKLSNMMKSLKSSKNRDLDALMIKNRVKNVPLQQLLSELLSYSKVKDKYGYSFLSGTKI
jgi:hypothetical protein